MSTIGFGPLQRVDGPPPLPQAYGILAAADAPAAGIRLITDVDANGIERWLNGVEVYPYPEGVGDVFPGCTVGSPTFEKDDGWDDDDLADDDDALKFDAFTAYLPVSCKSYKVWDQQEYKSRAIETFKAVESRIVADEFMRGARVPSNAHLANGESSFPNGDTVTSPQDGLALLEEAIAASGRQGVIHLSPAVLPALTLGNFIIDNRSGVLRTLAGTVLIADAGYAGGSTPTGHSYAEWMYATSPVDVRRTNDFFITPETAAQALDRGAGVSGATRGKSNLITYRVERYYLVSWDRLVHAAVAVDRCTTTCDRFVS